MPRILEIPLDTTARSGRATGTGSQRPGRCFGRGAARWSSATRVAAN